MKKIVKQLTALSLILAMGLGLTACGSGSGSASPAESAAKSAASAPAPEATEAAVEAAGSTQTAPEGTGYSTNYKGKTTYADIAEQLRADQTLDLNGLDSQMFKITGYAQGYSFDDAWFGSIAQMVNSGEQVLLASGSADFAFNFGNLPRTAAETEIRVGGVDSLTQAFADLLDGGVYTFCSGSYPSMIAPAVAILLRGLEGDKLVDADGKAAAVTMSHLVAHTPDELKEIMTEDTEGNYAFTAGVISTLMDADYSTFMDMTANSDWEKVKGVKKDYGTADVKKLSKEYKIGLLRNDVTSDEALAYETYLNYLAKELGFTITFSESTEGNATNEVNQIQTWAAAGCNWSFAPIVDTDMNWRNPITNVRTFGSDPDTVIAMSRAYMEGVREAGTDMAICIKHFPGDGVDERDQHLLSTVNSLSAEEWESTYGRIYRTLIQEGAQSVMAGHILQPEMTRKMCPGIPDEEILPVSTNRYLLTDLLRGQLGFNGLITTDATPMVGFSGFLTRRDAIAHAIMGGADVILFCKNINEDFAGVREDVERGVITLERLNEAVACQLALKASLSLHKKQKTGTLVPEPSALAILKKRTNSGQAVFSVRNHALHTELTIAW